jgi:hypothetical protein
MNAEFDYDLTPDQWEVLKALRTPVSKFSTLSRQVIRDLIALQLVTTDENVPVITHRGRKVLVRGSSRLWDVAA